MSTRGRVLVAVLMGTLTASTVLAGSISGLIKLALSLAPALGAFLLAGRLDHRGRRNVAIAVVVLGGIEAALAIMEPVLFPRHLWASAQVQLQVDTLVSAPDNGILAGMERSQGTLGHALPLGFLLMVSLGLLLRVVEPPALVKWLTAGLFIGAVIFAGSRNSLILAVFLLLFYPSRKLTSVRLIWAALLASIMVVLAMITGQISLTFVDQFVASGSYTHRVGVLDAFGQLLSKQSLLHTVVGNGFGSIPSLFARGLLQTDGFNVVDNQFVAALAQGGLIAMITMVILTVTPLVVRDRYWRAAALVILVNCMVYDWFNWTSSAAVGFFVYGCAYAQMRGRRPAPNRSTLTRPGESARSRSQPDPRADRPAGHGHQCAGTALQFKVSRRSVARLAFTTAAALAGLSSASCAATVPDSRAGSTNTGTGATALTSHHGDIVVTTPGTVIEQLDLFGSVYVRAPDVTIRGCRIRGSKGVSWNTGLVDCNHRDVRNALVEDCTLRPDYPSVWLSGVLGKEYTARRCDVSNVVDGFGAYNVTDPSAPTNVTIVNNYIHDLSYFSVDPNHANGPTHNDGIQVQGGSHIRIVANTILCSMSETAGTGDFPSRVIGQGILISPLLAPVTESVIENNYLDGGEAGIYLVLEGAPPWSSGRWRTTASAGTSTGSTGHRPTRSGSRPV